MFIIYNVRIGTNDGEYTQSVPSVHIDDTDMDIQSAEMRAVANLKLDYPGLEVVYSAISVRYKEGQYVENLVPPTSRVR